VSPAYTLEGGTRLEGEGLAQSRQERQEPRRTDGSRPRSPGVAGGKPRPCGDREASVTTPLLAIADLFIPPAGRRQGQGEHLARQARGHPLRLGVFARDQAFKALRLASLTLPATPSPHLFPAALLREPRIQGVHPDTPSRLRRRVSLFTLWVKAAWTTTISNDATYQQLRRRRERTVRRSWAARVSHRCRLQTGDRNRNRPATLGPRF